ncbi:hypothetical protein GALL_539340 [mine drainage metagenome]|uniref:Uncharacterized protein n=1 Tax=mine drainage metagenome TaxID=410659 RepID=A0A1J5PAN4_9ZZZZ
MQEVAQDVEPDVLGPDVFPQVIGRVTLVCGCWRIAGTGAAEVVRPAQIERQEEGLVAIELGGHEHFVGGHGEVHQGAGLELEQGFGLAALGVLRVPVLLVLLDGVGDVLGQVGLELSGGDRQAVDEQHEVDAVFVMQAVVQLTDDG